LKLGIALRSMGAASRPDVLAACAKTAEEAGLAEVWVQDHLAIPPDDAEGSGGRYLDPLTALAWIAGRTSRIGIATGVLNLPYRPVLPTAKAIATLQELSGERFVLGVGVGWMEAEFRALGVPRAERGRRSDTLLAFLHRAFAEDVVELEGQRFLFLPRPKRPPIYVGGAGEHALRRAARYGEGWLPMSADPKVLMAARPRLRELAEQAGRPEPEIAAFVGFDPRQPSRAADQLGALREAGVGRLVAGARYADERGFAEHVAFLAERVLPGLGT